MAIFNLYNIIVYSSSCLTSDRYEESFCYTLKLKFISSKTKHLQNFILTQVMNCNCNNLSRWNKFFDDKKK